jgi:hypothetical protein
MHREFVLRAAQAQLNAFEPVIHNDDSFVTPGNGIDMRLTQFSLTLRVARHIAAQIISANSGDIVPCGPKSACSSYWSLRIFTLVRVAVDDCAIRAAYLLAYIGALKSPRAMRESSPGSRVPPQDRGTARQTRLSARAAHSGKYPRNLNPGPPSSNPSRKIPPTRCWRNSVPLTSASQRNTR